MEKYLYSWIGRLTIVKMSKLSKMIYKIPMVFSAKTEKSILKFTWNLKGPWLSKTIQQKNQVRALILPGFKSYYKAIIIKTAWH